MSRIATLWPAGIRSRVVTPSATTMPAGRLYRAISTPSSGCRQITGAGVMGRLLGFAATSPRPLRGEVEIRICEFRVRGEARCQTPSLRSRIEAPHPNPLPAKSGARDKSLSLAAGFFTRLCDLHLGIGRHQPALVRQGHELEAHVDGAHGALRAAAMDAGIEAALAAFLDDLLVDLEDLRLVAIELRHQAVGEAEIGGADIDAVDALDIEDRFHVLDRGPGLHHREQHDLLVRG